MQKVDGGRPAIKDLGNTVEGALGASEKMAEKLATQAGGALSGIGSAAGNLKSKKPKAGDDTKPPTSPAAAVASAASSDPKNTKLGAS